MQIQGNNIVLIIIIITCIFFVAALFMLFYVSIFIERKKRHREEKEKMQQQFETALIQTQIEVQEETRKHLASDLHDNIGQLLSLTNVTLASININDKEKAEQKLADTQNLVTKSIKELRQLSKIIHGEQLIQQGLIPTIEQEINWLQRNGHYTVELVHDISGIETNNADKDLFLYRLLQESLNNTIKHSGADKITIQLHYANHIMQLSIRDNGTGFDAAEKMKQKSGLGLLNMQKRIDLLNGSMQIDSAQNKGTTISFIIPYP